MEWDNKPYGTKLFRLEEKKKTGEYIRICLSGGYSNGLFYWNLEDYLKAIFI